MTTDLRVCRAPDAFADNDVLRLRPAAALGEQKLAAIGWLTEGAPPREGHRRALEAAASLIRAKLPGYALWLLACHYAWQPESRIVHYRKLWGSFKASGLTVPFGRDAGEGVIRGAEGVRYFGALQLGLGALEAVAAVLEAERASHLVALRPQDEAAIATLVRAGWERPSFGPSAEVLAAVSGAQGVVVWPVGAFDDRESGAVALAQPEVVDVLMS